MKITRPSFEIWERDEKRGGLSIIEKAARTCYKTEDRITGDSAERIVRMLIQRRHEAMLEHGDYIFMLEDYHILDNVTDGLADLMSRTGSAPMLRFTNVGGDRPIISGNVRAWRELIASGTGAAYLFTGAIDPIYTEDLIPASERVHDTRIRQIRYADLAGEVERRTHIRQTVRFVVDRGVSHEFVRHRVMSFAQESTRYCNYADDRFGGEITVIEPCYLTPHTAFYETWKLSCAMAEMEYFAMLDMGLQAQEARAILPHSTKADLVMTGILSQWDHFFDLRARQITGPAHPQAAEVAVPLMADMGRRFPDVIRVN